ncbi:MAG: hypothetical protein NVS1B11_25810 [Terriglobales bacterium]
MAVTPEDYETVWPRYLKSKVGTSAFDVLKGYAREPGLNPPATLPGIVEVINTDQDLNAVAIAILAFSSKQAGKWACLTSER